MSNVAEINNNNRTLVNFKIPYRNYDILIVVSAILTLVGVILVGRFPHIFFKKIIPNVTHITKTKAFLISLPMFLGAFGCLTFIILKISHLAYERGMNISEKEIIQKERIRVCKEFLESNGHRVIIEET